MPHRALYAYPWDLDLAADGGHAALRILQDLGMDTLVLAASYHAGRFLRARSAALGGPALVVPEDGRVYFQPTPSLYGKLRPEPASLLRGGDPFAARPAGFRLEAWTVLLHNSRLGTAHPRLVARTAFGDPQPHSLCPSHAEVRDYSVALCRDLGRHDIDGLRIETPGWQVHRHGHHHEFDQVGPNPWLEALLGLCFCPACVAGAGSEGIEVEALQRRVASRIRAFLAGPAQPAPDMALAWMWEDLVLDPELAAFLRWRCAVVTNLVREIRAAIPAVVDLRVITTCTRPHAHALLEGHDLRALSAHAGLELPLYQPSPQAVEADLWDVLHRTVGSPSPSVILRPGPPDMGSEAQLKDTLARVRAMGIQDLAFYNFGLLRPPLLAVLGRILHDL